MPWKTKAVGYKVKKQENSHVQLTPKMVCEWKFEWWLYLQLFYQLFQVKENSYFNSKWQQREVTVFQVPCLILQSA